MYIIVCVVVATCCHELDTSKVMRTTASAPVCLQHRVNALMLSEWCRFGGAQDGGVGGLGRHKFSHSSC